MGLPFHIFFLAVYGLLVFHFGAHLQFRGMGPDYFLFVAIYLLRRSTHPHLILLTTATGITSDLIAGHSWSSDACFFVIMQVVMDRLGWTSSVRRPMLFLVAVGAWAPLHFGWWALVHDGARLHQLSAFLITNLLFALPFFGLFHLIRLGWAMQHRGGRSPILNA